MEDVPQAPMDVGHKDANACWANSSTKRMGEKTVIADDVVDPTWLTMRFVSAHEAGKAAAG